MKNIELKRSPGTCCPDPTCDERKDPLICESCGCVCSECKRIKIVPGEYIFVKCAYCKKKIKITPRQSEVNNHNFCDLKCRNKFQRERTRDYQGNWEK